jgi:pectin methylesterase-like acyl-CoA thioesterase
MRHRKASTLAQLLIAATLLGGCGSASTDAPDSRATPMAATTPPPPARTTTAATVQSVPAATYLPAKGDSGVHTDTRLQLTFDAPPVLGTSGLIRIYRQSDDTLVDTIDLSMRHPVAALSQSPVSIDAIGKNVGPLSGTRMRHVFYFPVKITGNTATIVPHTGVLLSDTAYYVTVDSNAFTGTIAGSAFAGIGKSSGWFFTTRSAPTGTTVTVDDDGAADFRTVQGAINYMMNIGSSSNCKPTCPSAGVAKTINIRNGVYDELLLIRNVNKLTLLGESRDGVVVQYDNSDGLNPGSGGTNAAPSAAPSLGGGRSVLLIEGSDEIVMENFTLKNAHVKTAGVGGQAEAFYFNSSSTTGSRLTGKYMNFYGTQDTIQTKGWAWFYKSTITGDVDFIWGGAFAGLFEECEIRTRVDTMNAASGGYIVHARTAYGYPGFVFLNSRLTAEAGVPAGSTALARSPGAGTNLCSAAGQTCDNVAYINTRMGPHIKTAGWCATGCGSNPNPNPALATDDTGWREYASLDAAGAPLDLSRRDSHSAQMSPGGYASKYSSRAQVFSQWNNGVGWAPSEGIRDVSTSVKIMQSGLTLNRNTGLMSGTVTFTNVSNTSISGPLLFRLDNLTAGVSLDNRTGMLDGAPTITLPTSMLAPGESVTVPTSFQNPNRVLISYTPKMFNGTP